MDRRWEQQLRDKMSQYSQSEPEGLWEGIMQQMDLISSEKKNKGKKRNNVFIMACATAAAAAIAAFFMLQENHIRSMPPKADIYALYDNNAENVLHVQDIPSPRRIAMAERTIKQSCDKITEPDTKNMSAPTEAHETETATVSPYPATADGNQKNAPSEIEEEYAPYVFPDTDVKREKRSRSRKRFSTSLSVSNLTGDSHSYGGFGTIQPAASSFKGIPVKDVISTIPGNGIMLLSGGNESNTEIRHRQPIRAGVSFKYYLTDRWGAETGIVYSYLSSRMETGNSSMYSSKTDQQLHYIGVPFKISYDIFDLKYLTIYAGAGGMVEKCISGTARNRTGINGTDLKETTDRLTIKPLQWSVSAEAGIQGNITDFLGIYIEPGVSWHFDNKSIVSTIYKEKPLNFNIEFGLRFSFD